MAFRPFVADDAFIVGRYALNAASGHGLVYNAGEQVSALTSPLHALLLTVFAWVTSDPVTLYRSVMPLCVLATVFAAFSIYRATRVERVIVLVLGLASPFVVLWSGGGLETPMLACLLTLFTALLMRTVRTGEARNKDLVLLGTLTGLAFLTRFDSVLVTFPPALALMILCYRRPAFWLGAAMAAVLAGSWLGFAFIYYGDVLPTSVYTKVSGGVAPLNGIASVVNFALLGGVFLGLPFLIASKKMPNGAASGALVRAVKAGGVLSGSCITAYALKVSGVHMMFGYRMFVPIIIPVAMVVAAWLTPRVGLVFAGAQGVVQMGVAVMILTVGINVSPVRDFGPLGRWSAEFSSWTPAEYGRFMSLLAQDGAVLEAHWAETGRNGTPKVYLSTGGMGYWLPSFYVYEALVSYRHECYAGTRWALAASDYVQDLDNSVAHVIREIYDTDRPSDEVVRLARSFLRLGEEGGWDIQYRYAPSMRELTLPARTRDACMLGGDTMLAQN